MKICDISLCLPIPLWAEYLKTRLILYVCTCMVYVLTLVSLSYMWLVIYFQTSERCAHLALKHYMLKPVQRIPQYKMLLDSKYSVAKALV